ncbi:MAG: low-specificity L-threonine aldolase [Chloroflexota bacterium]|nr:low-specificity L-threonine aldolase [Chloroflexota bacterium]
MKAIDLRSDTVTKPTPEMREAMYRAEVGDDVYEEDPTMNRLQEMSAERLGKEAALFVASGTMGNLISLLTYCGRGDEFIIGDLAHTFLYETGGSAALGGIHPHTIPNQPDGTLRLDDVEAAIRSENIHFPRTRLVCLENTHNRCGGTVLTPEYTSAVCELAHAHGLRIHLDGARIFNAAIALGVDVRKLTRSVDSVMFCLSKGLSAPVGSLLCGSEEFIGEARRMRKMVGGGMRQVGILAAAGIVALEKMVDRLAEDHETGRQLAEGIAATPGLTIDLQRVQTNIVIFGLADEVEMTTQGFVAALAQRGVKLNAIGDRRFRAVTHYGITAEDIEESIAVLQQVMGSG